MSAAQDSLRRLDTVAQVVLRLAQTTRSGRVALAQLDAALDHAWIKRPEGDRLLALLSEASRASREPLSIKQVESTLKDAWDIAPKRELDELDPEPHAVTPLAQVHRGVLDGADVAIKVLRPGLAGTMRQDLVVLQALAAPLAAAFPALNVGAVLHEIRERMLEELDLESEAAMQRRFHRGLRGHPFLSVPAPITRLCNERVLVSEWIDGVPLWQTPDPDRAAAMLLAFVMGAARWGVAYADAHGENALITHDGGLAIIDFGTCRQVDAARIVPALGALEALARRDHDQFTEHLQQLGWLAPDHAPEALELIRELLGELLDAGSSRLDVSAVIELRDRVTERAEDLATLLQRGSLAPEDLWPARALGLLFGTVARLGATGDWTELSLSALRDGWA